MADVIVVAGATGNLGGRIVHCLVERGAVVRALVRPETTAEKVAPLERTGASVVRADATRGADLARACEGAACVVSALQGMRDVIVDAQTALLEGALAAKVTRFIPSDFAADFTKLTDAENRNFAFRRAFRERVLAAPIRSTSILNGAFTEILMYGTPMLDFERRSVGYWESADQPLDFTTMDDTAAFTAAAALDASAPPVLRVAGDSLSARTLAEVASEVKGHAFELARMGSLDDLAGYIARERAAHPETENEVFPRWQSSQYMHNMFSGRAKLEPLDNARYPGIRYTTVRDFIAAAGARGAPRPVENRP